VPNDIAERNWLITVAGIPGTFQTITGGGVSAEHTKRFDGGSLTPKVYQGPPQTADVTVGRDWQSPRDDDTRRSLNAQLGAGRRFETTVNAIPLDDAMIPIGEAHVYEAVLREVGPPEGNANSAQPSTLTLVLTCKRVR